MSKLTESLFFNEFINACDICCKMGWNERNGGNMSYRIPQKDLEIIKEDLDFSAPFVKTGVKTENLSNEFFMVTGSGKYFRFTKEDPENNVAIVQLDGKGESYRIVWGLESGGRPTSEFPAHLLNHSVKKDLTGGKYRLVLHTHPANIIALSFVLPQTDKDFTRELWEIMPECVVVFPKGVGVLPPMLPGSVEIAEATAEKFKRYDTVVWSLHGVMAAGEDFKTVFGIIETVEKAAEILIKVISAGGKKIRPTAKQIYQVAESYNIEVNKSLLD